jgi:hypothetical protein
LAATKTTPAPLTRTLSEIADEIGEDWPKVREGGQLDPLLGLPLGQHPANPYWQAMCQCTGITRLDGYYGCDRISSVVRTFLSNATGWRGDKARMIKAELQAALADYDTRRAVRV